MPSLKLKLFGKPAFRSADEYAHKADVEPGEFPEGHSELPTDEVSRRGILQFLGASAAFAGLAGCLKQPDEKILPYGHQPPEVKPGNALHYATASTLGGIATGLLVTAHEGRPTKIEGNPDHPTSRGRSGVLEQGDLLSLYDPNRLKAVQYRTQPRAWRDFLAAMAAKLSVLRQNKGAGLRFLMEPSSSPLIAHLRERILAEFPQAKFSTWSAVPLQQIHDGAQLAFGRALEPRIDLTQAQMIASLDADFLSSLPGTLPLMKAWADKREPGAEMNRLYQVETHFSVTGMNADHRLRVKPTDVQRFGFALLGRLASRVGQLASYAPLAQQFKLEGEQAKFADVLARELAQAGSRAVVLVGPRQPPALHAAAHAINAALGSAAYAVAPPVLHDTDAGPRALRTLAEEMRSGAVDTLVITAWNPSYGAPADLNFGKALSQVPTSVYHSMFQDETAERAGWVIPASHQLESWGDARAHDGTVTFVQPLIAPLYASQTQAEVLAAFLGEGDRTTYTQLRELWRAKADDATWEKWISDGFIAGSATSTEKPAVRHDAILAAARAVPAAETAGGLEINIVPGYTVYDGRFADNAWLQELPDPVTKLTWDNAAIVSPATAKALGLKQGDLVDLNLRGPPAHAPVVVLPGHADDAVTVSMGYGRAGPGESVARGVGFDTADLRHTDAPWFAAGLTVLPRGARYPLAQTQEHHSMNGRLLAAVSTLEKLKESNELLEEHRGVPETFHPPVEYSGYRWAMAIDLTRCTGCNACAIACVAENNIPVVGKVNVAKSREMHWLRVDRYFTGHLDNPGVVFQPLMCVQCESAPCEYVCPVNATVHSDEGLNEMIYNRCVGTRYCSNNCPYKVRRFNFFAYTTDYTDSEKMVFNPDVTVRSRGVMEKCTYCVQRIERARIDTRVQGRTIKDGEVLTACQQACPTDAIVFGDLNQPEAKVTRLLKDDRRYDLLHELGTRPRTGYLQRVTNPNPELA